MCRKRIWNVAVRSMNADGKSKILVAFAEEISIIDEAG